MNVAYVTPFYNGQCEGRFGRFHDWIHELRSMEDRPFDFDVIATTASNPDETLSSRPPGYLGNANELWATKTNNVEFLFNLRRIQRDLHQANYDIVHILRLDSMLYPLTMSVVGTETPVVLGPNIGGWSPTRSGGQWEQETLSGWVKQNFNFRFRRLLASKARYDRVLAFSDYHRQILSDMGFSSGDAEIIHPGVNSMFSPDGGGQGDVVTLLYVGDLTKHKGYDLFLRCLAEIEADVEALIAGRGSPDTDLIRSLGIADTVTHLGFVERKKLPNYYRNSDIYIIPSVDEMGPNTQIEALACGTPVVSTDLPGLNEYPPAEASVFFSPRTSQRLAAGIRTAIRNIDELTQAARSHAPNFRAQKTIEFLYGLYSRLLGNSPAS